MRRIPRTDNFDNDDPKYQDNETTTPAVILNGAQLVTRDEGANLDNVKVEESMIQQEVESRLLKQQKEVLVAEPVDAAKLSIDIVGTEQAVTKIFGIMHRKVFVYVMVVVVLVAVVVAGVAVLVTKPQEQSTLEQQLKPWIYRSASEEDAKPFDDPTSPQSLALDWLLNDRIAVSENGVAATVLQTYALAVLYDSTDGPSWKMDVKFLSESDACSWNDGLINEDENEQRYSAGLHCQPRPTIQFRRAGLHGTIPWELSLLSDLVFLRMDENSLFGTLPTEFGRLTALEILNFSNNSLTGIIPTELAALTALEEFSMNGNNLHGTLSTELGSWRNMGWFYVQHNRLTGTLPTELGKWTALEESSIVGNEFVGTSPTEFGRLSLLQSLEMNANSLTGTLPTELGTLTALTWLSLRTRVDITEVL